ncbi:MAG: SDR family oxidoreductase [Bacteroidetes bacterium]|nr:MAG: SDR family oxidoreductase [Bacteroidota bacterium]
MLKKNSLQRKTIIVTGGGTGLGRSMVKCFLQLGANVVITSRKMDVLEKCAEELRKEVAPTLMREGKDNRSLQSGGQAVNILPVKCDVRNYEEVETMMKIVINKFGSFNVLLNNAAGNFISPTERLSHRAFDTVVDIVLKGSYNCSIAAGKYWIKEKIKGTVLSTLTPYAFTGSAFVVPSACGKAGVLALTQSLAVEWGKYGIRLNAISPGPFPSEGAWTRLLPGDLMKKFDPAKSTALNRLGDHQELANLAAYMVSDFSSFMTGENVVIDGGQWLKGAGTFNALGAMPDEMWNTIEQLSRKGKSI